MVSNCALGRGPSQGARSASTGDRQPSRAPLFPSSLVISGGGSFDLLLRFSSTASKTSFRGCSLPLAQRWVVTSATCDGCRPCRCGRTGDGETRCSKVRSDEVQDGPSLRSQATTGPCGLASAGAGGRPSTVPLSGVGFGEHRRPTSPDATSLSSTGDKPSRYFSDSFYNEG